VSLVLLFRQNHKSVLKNKNSLFLIVILLSLPAVRIIWLNYYKRPKFSSRGWKITTDHGVIETPIFMPVGTVASVEVLHQRELRDDINLDIILEIPTIYTCITQTKFLKNWRFYTS
jgi:hypothetical protein